MNNRLKINPVSASAAAGLERPKQRRTVAEKAPRAREAKVPFLRPALNDAEISEVVDTLRSGWLTTGPKTKIFERDFARAVRGAKAVAVNSCTAALHLAVEALGLRAGQAVLVPTMTFAATAEIVLYKNAIPILVDCDPATGNMDLADARRKIEAARAGRLSPIVAPGSEIVGIIPVHVGGLMMDIAELKKLAAEFVLWTVEDAAHAFPAAWRSDDSGAWQMCGENTADATCYSFYANKTITTGEGGMIVTNSDALAEKIRLMSLHGLSRDAWARYTENGNWDYRIVAPGYKYNLTDIAAAIGIHQLARAEAMRREREQIARFYLENLAAVEELELPPDGGENRLHAWHLFPIRLKLEKLDIDRGEFIEELKRAGVGCSVHWRPLHLHPLYEDLGWRAESLPQATRLWQRLISLPIFPGMTDLEIEHVIETVKNLCLKHAKKNSARAR